MTLPVITSISPNSGPLAGGTTITIIGTTLTSVTAIHFGATACAAGTFGALSAILAVATAPAHVAGAVDVTVTTAGGTSAASYLGQFVYSDGLFTVDEAREFSGGTLNKGGYKDAAILAAELAIREAFNDICAVAFCPTVVTDEPHDSDGSDWIVLNHAKVTAVSAISVNGVALTAAELSTADYSSGLAISVTGRIDRRNGYFYPGRQNILVSYTHGFTAVPAEIKHAALIMLCAYIKPTDVSARATSYSDGNMTFQMSYPGPAPHWYGIPEVDSILARPTYNFSTGGIA